MIAATPVVLVAVIPWVIVSPLLIGLASTKPHVLLAP